MQPLYTRHAFIHPLDESIYSFEKNHNLSFLQLLKLKHPKLRSCITHKIVSRTILFIPILIVLLICLLLILFWVCLTKFRATKKEIGEKIIAALDGLGKKLHFFTI